MDFYRNFLDRKRSVFLEQGENFPVYGVHEKNY